MQLLLSMGTELLTRLCAESSKLYYYYTQYAGLLMNCGIGRIRWVTWSYSTWTDPPQTAKRAVLSRRAQKFKAARIRMSSYAQPLSLIILTARQQSVNGQQDHTSVLQFEKKVETYSSTLLFVETSS